MLNKRCYGEAGEPAAILSGSAVPNKKSFEPLRSCLLQVSARVLCCVRACWKGRRPGSKQPAGCAGPGWGVGRGGGWGASSLRRALPWQLLDQWLGLQPAGQPTSHGIHELCPHPPVQLEGRAA